MSLLLDAMKKSGQHAQGTGLSLEALPNQSAQNATPDAAAQVEATRAAGQNLFAAKKKSAPPRWRWKLGLVPTTFLICSTIGAGYGYYVWREINPPVQPMVARAVPPPPPRQVTAPPAPLVAAITPEPAPVRSATPAPAPAGVREAPQPKQSSPTTPSASAPAGVQKARTSRGAARAPSAPRLAIQRKTQADTITPVLQDAWQAWQRGDFVAAEAGYRNVLAQDARNRDALLGLGAIAQRNGKDQQAQQFYRQVLLLDPRDPVALAAMTAYVTPDNEGAEIRLRQMLDKQPRAAVLHYALGNVYMEQSRWAEAQQAYFTALALEPGNPQFSYNLAVSLDHLGQRKLAADYYRQTLQWDPSGLSGFDAVQTQRRLNELSAPQ